MKHKVDILGLLSLVALGIFVLICISPSVAGQGYASPTTTPSPTSTTSPTPTNTVTPTVTNSPQPSISPSISPPPSEDDKLYRANVTDALNRHYCDLEGYDASTMDIGLIEHTDSYTEDVIKAIYPELKIKDIVQVTLTITYIAHSQPCKVSAVVFLGHSADEWLIVEYFDTRKWL